MKHPEEQLQMGDTQKVHTGAGQETNYELVQQM